MTIEKVITFYELLVRGDANGLVRGGHYKSMETLYENGVAFQTKEGDAIPIAMLGQKGISLDVVLQSIGGGANLAITETLTNVANAQAAHDKEIEDAKARETAANEAKALAVAAEAAAKEAQAKADAALKAAQEAADALAAQEKAAAEKAAFDKAVADAVAKLAPVEVAA